MKAPDPPARAEPVYDHSLDLPQVDARIGDVPLFAPRHRTWIIGFAFSFLVLCLLFCGVAWLFIRGVGIWGINIPIAWGFAIVNFVWWIGIGHAGTFISAFLLLLHQPWRTSINRFTEAMTLFAVACAGLFPLLHLGRPQFFYWLFPYPDTMGVWPQFRSPLTWDVCAVSSYFIVSLIFWYAGLLPDLATLRDRADTGWKQRMYGVLSLGWRGDARHWVHYEKLYVILAGLATPLVISVHSIVSLDFTIAIVPGWHTTIFPPYFVAGAIYSGFAMVLTLVIPLRKLYRLEPFITDRHLDLMAKVMMTTGWIVTYGYFTEYFTAWWSGDNFERYIQINRAVGPYARLFWLMVACNVVTPQFLWFRRIRRNVPALFVISLLVNVGMWVERYVIVVMSLYRDFLPSSWGWYAGTRWDWAVLIGSMGLFLSLIFLFVRFLPAISMTEMKLLVVKKGEVS